MDLASLLPALKIKGAKPIAIPFVPATSLVEPLPTRGGRSSEVTSGVGLYGFLMGEMAQITPNFEIELLKLCTHLAKFNGDISYAVDNIVQLGNTPAVVSFGATPGLSKDKQEALSKEMTAYLLQAEKKIYRGGMNSLKNDLFAQIAINGCLSAEAIPSLQVDRIQKAAIVAPYYVRFLYNEATYEYDAYQRPPLFMPGDTPNGLKKLNPLTYRYYGLRLFDDNPYAIPPFISALETMEIEKDMLKNMKHIVRKLGLFGFLSVMVSPPTKKQGEKDEEYQARAQAYLDKIKAEVEKGYGQGISLGYKNAIEFKVEASTTNLTGAKDLFELVTQMKAAGIKQDPLMIARNFNVAETMARVIMAKLTTQVANFQRVVATFCEDLYYLMLRMGGYNPPSVSVEFAPPMIGDKLRDEQAYAAQIQNNTDLRDRGVINQTTFANNLGYDAAVAPKDVDYSVLTASDRAANAAKSTDPKKTADPNQATDPTASGSTNYGYSDDLERMFTLDELYISLHKGVSEFVYEVANCGCGGHHTLSYADKGDERVITIDEYILLYKTAIGKEYQKSVDKVAVKVGEALAELGKDATVEEVTDRIFYILYSQWGGGFTKSQKKIIERWVTDIYGYFRESTSMFPSGIKIPEVVFNLHDIRALTYFKNSDELYLGKFVTDSDTRKRITAFIKENYLQNGSPIGNSPEAIAKFQEAFSDVLMLEDWKIRRIIDTSVNMMRNYAAISYMKQAEILNFQVLGINDGRQCAYCRHMNGMIFSLDTAYQRTDQVVNSFPDAVKMVKPFVTGVFKGQDGIDQFTELDSETIQKAGIDCPSYHPFCRCTVVAVL